MFEKNKAFEAHPKFQVSRNSAPEKKMPAFDVARLLEEDKTLEGLDIPFRFGKSFDVNMGLKDGQWAKTDSTEIWSLKISSPKAYSLNFIFSELYLPEGAELHVFNEDGSMVYGPVTEKQNQYGRIFLTDIIQGESATIQIEAPLKTKEEPLLTIQKVIHGYKDLFRSLKVGYGDSGACFDDYNSDVICYPNWNDESDGVVQILLAGGDELCSGSLLNNTAQDYRPFILTAFHCIDIGDPSIINDPDRGNGVLSDDEISQAEEWLVRFRFRHTTCGGGVIANGFTFDDTHFRAAWNTTDFALVELQDNIISDIYSVGAKVWLGWDRTGNIPSSGTCIHHPSGDIAKISFENNSLIETNYLQSTGTSHWRVYNWDYGVTERGSSVSPLFDQNKRVVGQLHGGYSSCEDPDDPDWYGCFHHSWTGGGTNTTRLSNWLDPLGTGVTTLNSVRQPVPQYSSEIGVLCSSESLSITNLAPGYYLDHWNYSSNISLSSDHANPVQITAVSPGDGWVQAVYHTGWGTVAMDRMTFGVIEPEKNDFHFTMQNTSTGEWVSNFTNNDGNPTELCPNTTYQLTTSNNGPFTMYDLEWGLPSGWEIQAQYGSSNHITTYLDVNDNVHTGLSLSIETECGWSNNFPNFYFLEDYSCSSYFLLLSPNPTTGETTLTIETNSSEKTFDETAEWELEVYSETQLLKTKQTGLHGQSAKIQTAGWKEGVYLVRVNYNGEILTGKLVVKR
jgi:hypothetical protein